MDSQPGDKSPGYCHLSLRDRLPACIERRRRLVRVLLRGRWLRIAWTQKAKLFGGSIQGGSLCYFALWTGTRGVEIILQTPPRSCALRKIKEADAIGATLRYADTPIRRSVFPGPGDKFAGLLSGALRDAFWPAPKVTIRYR